jgi:hypothetical protein
MTSVDAIVATRSREYSGGYPYDSENSEFNRCTLIMLLGEAIPPSSRGNILSIVNVTVCWLDTLVEKECSGELDRIKWHDLGEFSQFAQQVKDSNLCILWALLLEPENSCALFEIGKPAFMAYFLATSAILSILLRFFSVEAFIPETIETKDANWWWRYELTFECFYGSVAALDDAARQFGTAITDSAQLQNQTRAQSTVASRHGNCRHVRLFAKISRDCRSLNRSITPCPLSTDPHRQPWLSARYQGFVGKLGTEDALLNTGWKVKGSKMEAYDKRRWGHNDDMFEAATNDIAEVTVTQEVDSTTMTTE